MEQLGQADWVMRPFLQEMVHPLKKKKKKWTDITGAKLKKGKKKQKHSSRVVVPIPQLSLH